MIMFVYTLILVRFYTYKNKLRKFMSLFESIIHETAGARLQADNTFSRIFMPIALRAVIIDSG